MPADTSKIALNRRAKLESLRSCVSAGPLIDGLNKTDEILVASFYNRRICQRFRNSLSAEGISSSTKSNRIKISVFVRNADRLRTFELLDGHQEKHPDKRPTGIRRDYDGTILCTLIGTFGGLPFLATPEEPLFRIVSWTGSIVSGVCVGSMLDRCRRNYYHFGQLQFSVAEFLAFTAVAASLIAFWSFVFRL